MPSLRVKKVVNECFVMYIEHKSTETSTRVLWITLLTYWLNSNVILKKLNYPSIDRGKLCLELLCLPLPWRSTSEVCYRPVVKGAMRCWWVPLIKSMLLSDRENNRERKKRRERSASGEPQVDHLKQNILTKGLERQYRFRIASSRIYSMGPNFHKSILYCGCGFVERKTSYWKIHDERWASYSVISCWRITGCWPQIQTVILPTIRNGFKNLSNAHSSENKNKKINWRLIIIFLKLPSQKSDRDVLVASHRKRWISVFARGEDGSDGQRGGGTNNELTRFVFHFIFGKYPHTRTYLG